MRSLGQKKASIISPSERDLWTAHARANICPKSVFCFFCFPSRLETPSIKSQKSKKAWVQKSVNNYLGWWMDGRTDRPNIISIIFCGKNLISVKNKNLFRHVQIIGESLGNRKNIRRLIVVGFKGTWMYENCSNECPKARWRYNSTSSEGESFSLQRIVLLFLQAHCT